MTEEKVKYDTVPGNLNELKERFEAGGGNWQDALLQIKEATEGKDIAAAMKEGWTMTDFARVLLGEDGETQTAEPPKQNPTQIVSHNFTEAPASFNVKAYSPQGFDIMLTLRDGDTKALMDRAEGALAWLSSKGFRPTGRRSSDNSGNNSGGNDGNPDTKICSIHHQVMRKREKHGEVWYSHKAVNPDTGEEYWCKGAAK
jgi:hypothetical protein